MANVTIKDLDDADLRGVAERAGRLGLSTQEYLRRMIAREVRRPVVEDQLAALAERRRTGKQPMSLQEFDQARRRALRSS